MLFLRVWCLAAWTTPLGSLIRSSSAGSFLARRVFTLLTTPASAPSADTAIPNALHTGLSNRLACTDAANIATMSGC